MDANTVDRLLMWGKEHFRAFPWRNPQTSPWQLLVAEVLLKRELGDRVTEVWRTLVTRYPTPEKMARARRSTLERLLRPLGLQGQRAQTLTAVARALAASGGIVPRYQSLLELPGVGPYIAGAVEVFAHGGRAPLLDPNILRIGSRYYGRPATQAASRRQLARDLLAAAPVGNEKAFYYALLDLGALLCRKSPMCSICPLNPACSYPPPIQKESNDS